VREKPEPKESGQKRKKENDKHGSSTDLFSAKKKTCKAKKPLFRDGN